MVLPAGSLSLMNPEEPHTGHAATPWLRYNMLYASEAAVCSMLETRDLRGFSTVAPRDKGFALSRRLAALAAYLNEPTQPDRKLRIEEAAHDVLTQCFVRYGRVQLRRARRERDAISIMREQISAGVETGTDLSLTSLADTVQLSPGYLIRATRRETGLTPHGLVVRARIERAHRLLLEKTPAAEAAAAAGFCDQAHLIRQYRRYFGVTPSAVIKHT